MSGAALIQRLEAAGEGSRELDALVNLRFHHDREYLWSLSGLNAQRPLWKDIDLDKTVLRCPSEYGLDRPVTTSLDAALALAERVLPGWDWSVTTITTSFGGVKKVNALIVHPDHPSDKDISTFGEANTPALALCAAILRARSAGESQ
jgi:hypothetical protein